MKNFIATCGLCPTPFSLGADTTAIAKNIHEITLRVYGEKTVQAQKDAGTFNMVFGKVREIELAEARRTARREAMELMHELASVSICRSEVFLRTPKSLQALRPDLAAITAALDTVRTTPGSYLRYSVCTDTEIGIDISWDDGPDAVKVPVLDHFNATSPAVDNPYVQWFMPPAPKRRRARSVRLKRHLAAV